MSFAFAAIGTKEEVLAQLERADISAGEHRFNAFGADLRDLLVKHFGHEREHAKPGPGYEYRYTVKANGHGGGTVPLSLQLTVESHWMPELAPAEAEPDPAE